jgi:DNA mismatch repair protein MutS2
LEDLTRQQNDLTESLQEKEKIFKFEKSKRIQAFVRESKNQVRQMMQEAKGSSDISKLRKIERELGMIGRIPLSEHRDDLSEWKVTPEKLKKGDLVLIESYGATGVLLENPTGKKKVRISLGKIETVIETVRLKGSLKKRPVVDKALKQVSVNIHTKVNSQVKTKCDLRGMNSEEALLAMETFLSQAIANGITQGVIIHGHGMGIIKSLVRDYLSSTGICTKFSSAPRDNGGDGATVVEF